MRCVTPGAALSWRQVFLTLHMPDIDSFFSSEGPLARTVSGYSPRAQQLEMAQAIAETIAANSVLVAEAGTGTGKTFAYLVPALLGGGKGHHLHRHQDLAGPAVQPRHSYRARGAQGAGHRGVAERPGQLRLSLSSGAHAAGGTRQPCQPRRGQVSKLIERYANVSKSGDKSGLSEVPENAAIWQQVTSTRDNCLGSECPHLQELLCHGGAQAGAGGGCCRRQSSPLFRRRHAA